MFESLYRKYIDLRNAKRKERVEEEMRPYFFNAEKCKAYVDAGFMRKRRNLICRRVRM